MSKSLPQLAYKPGEVAAILGISRPVVYALINTERLRCVRVGRLMLVPTDAIEEFLGRGQPRHEAE